MQNIQSIIDDVMANKFHFLAAFFCIFTLSYGLLYMFDFYPEPVPVKVVAVATTPEVVVKKVAEVKPVATDTTTTIKSTALNDTLPQSIYIPALDRTVDVLNPASKSLAALDAALLEGTVRHPDSATLGEEGNMLIFGHSSYLPTVFNRNYQAFNGIQNLKWGETIILRTKDTEYTYKVEKNYKVKASGFTVPVAGKGKTLTLVTCNNFATEDDRFIVEATLISTKAL